LQELKDQSRVYLRRSIELEPNFLPAIIELALIDEEEKDPDFVIGELLKIENLSPEVKYHIGRIYFNKGDIESAAKKFSEVIEQVPTHSNSRYSLGIIYFRMGKYNESLSEFEEVLRLNPGNLDVEDKINQVKNKIGI